VAVWGLATAAGEAQRAPLWRRRRPLSAAAADLPAAALRLHLHLQLRRPVEGGILYGNADPGMCNEAMINEDMTMGGLGKSDIDMCACLPACKIGQSCRMLQPVILTRRSSRQEGGVRGGGLCFGQRRCATADLPAGTST
jgi:hypothetical protein